MTAERLRQGLLDTNIVILRKWLDPGELPEEMAISAITLAELSAGPHEVRGNAEQDAYDEHARTGAAPGDLAAGRERVRPGAVRRRRRVADLMIAATAMAEGLPLFTTNPGDFAGLEDLIRVVAVTRPSAPPEGSGSATSRTQP